MRILSKSPRCRACGRKISASMSRNNGKLCGRCLHDGYNAVVRDIARDIAQNN